jgi:hypothetical protein
MDHSTALKKFADNAPNKKNGSPQFSDEGVTAHSMHSGRKGGNVLDQKAGAAIAKTMLQALADGDFVIVSVDPPDYADPAKLAAQVAAVDSGEVKVKKIVTSQIAEEGQSRMKSVSHTFEGGALPSLTVVYKTNEKHKR